MLRLMDDFRPHDRRADERAGGRADEEIFVYNLMRGLRRSGVDRVGGCRLVRRAGRPKRRSAGRSVDLPGWLRNICIQAGLRVGVG